MKDYLPQKKFQELSKTPLNSLSIAFKKLSFILFMALLATLPIRTAFASAADDAAVLALVPLTSVDRTVVQDGAWSDPSTWSGGILPQAGENLYVPADKALLVDIDSNASLRTLRVDGILSFATDKNVGIKLDTLVVTHSGTFEIGSEENRVPNTNKITITIANNGPIDRAWDPANISRGVIIQGATRIYGAEKSAYHRLAFNPAANSSQIQLDTAPTGWKVGDLVVITATRFRKKLVNDSSYLTQDELRRIRDISGNTVTLGTVANQNVLGPLLYSHVPLAAAMPVYAANLTRNVVFAGEGGKLIPANQRGHFMVMHNPATVIKGAGFEYLGRTDKSIPLDDFQLDSNGHRLNDANGNYIVGPSTNPRGRYAVHFHHTGTDINTPPVICSGNAVISSPGWGFVNHTSNVIMENNASYDVFGSHFVSEDGNEIGAFRHNIAIKAEGRDVILKVGTANHDLGHAGHGFWLESRNLSVEDNVVSGVNNAGAAYFHRVEVEGIDTEIPWQVLLTPYKAIAKNLPTIPFGHVPVVDQKNMTVLSSGSALAVVKGQLGQNHDVRNIFESVKGYAIMDGLQLQYTEKYTFRNLELVADPQTTVWDKGFNVTRQVRDVVISDAKIEGFVHPFVTSDTFNGLPDVTDIIFSNVFVNGRPINPITDIHQPSAAVISSYDPELHVVNDHPNPGVLDFSTTLTSRGDIPLSLAQKYIVSGVKTDSLGKIDFNSTWETESLIGLLKRGYYTRPDGKKCVYLTDMVADRLSGETKIYKTQLVLTKNYKILGPKLGQLPN